MLGVSYTFIYSMRWSFIILCIKILAGSTISHALLVTNLGLVFKVIILSLVKIGRTIEYAVQDRVSHEVSADFVTGIIAVEESNVEA